MSKAIFINFVNENGFKESLKVQHIQREDDNFKYGQSAGKQYAGYINKFYHQLTHPNMPNDFVDQNHKFYEGMLQFLGLSCVEKKEVLSKKFMDRLKEMRKRMDTLITDKLIKRVENKNDYIIIKHRDENERDNATTESEDDDILHRL